MSGYTVHVGTNASIDNSIFEIKHGNLSLTQAWLLKNLYRDRQQYNYVRIINNQGNIISSWQAWQDSQITSN